MVWSHTVHAMVRERESPTAGGRVSKQATTVPRFETYETGPETVIFDGENPLAWIASRSAISLKQYA